MAADKAYWAAKPPAEMLKEATKRIDLWFNYIQTESGDLALWRSSLMEYYAGETSGGQIGVAGEQEELTTIKVNHAHNIGEHVITAVAGQAPAFVPQAQNNDHEATSQTDIARVILEAAVSQKGLGDVFVQTTRRAWVLKEGYATAEWDERMGEPYAGIGDQLVKTGDVRLRTYTPENVIRDHARDNGGAHEWWILRRWENRYAVIARAKAQAGGDQVKAQAWEDHLLSLPSKAEETNNRPTLTDWARRGPGATKHQLTESDEIAVYEFRHAKNDALPQGRRTTFVSAEVWLEDGALPFRDPYVFRMVPEERIGEEGGYTPHFDLMAPQQGVNAAYSSVLSGLAALGHPVIHAQANANVEVEQLKPFTLVKAQGELKAVSLLPEGALKPHAEFADRLVAQMEIVSGVNSVRRGNAASLGASSSGAKLALIDAKFYESIVGLQRSFKDFASAVATAIVQLYQDFAKVEQTVSVAGKDKRVAAKTFTGEGIRKVLRVDIEMGDPLSRTASGRLEIAQMMLTAVGSDGRPMIKTPEQLIQVVRTGRLDPMIQGQGSELDNIKAENELLGDGKPALTFIYDNHPLHIQEHYAVMASPEARTNEVVMNAVLAHIAEHLTQWQQAPLDGLAARQIPPPPSLAMMSQPGVTNGTPAPKNGATSSTEVPGPDEAGPQPSMPNLPTNPATGEPAPGPPMV